METALLTTRSTYFLTLSGIDEVFIRSHITELRSIIAEHNSRYYQTANPIISDAEYDQLFALLIEREERFPDLLTTNSPTQRLV
jgi:DNA ligase (NAD+)